MIWKYLGALFCSLLFFSIVHSQERVAFKTINADMGLSDNYVESAFEGNDGFMWFATHNGLSRYDGHSFTTITIPQISKNEMPSTVRNFILCVNEDADKNLWIGTLWGLYMYNRSNNTFTKKYQTPANTKFPTSNLCEHVVFTEQQDAWIGTRDGLYFYNKKKASFTRYESIANDTNSLSNNYIQALLIDSQHGLWVGTRNGGLDYKSASESHFTHFNKSQLQFVRDIKEDKNGTIWVATAQNGVYYKQKSKKSFLKLTLPSWAQNFILSSIAIDKRDVLWIGTVANGVIRFDSKHSRCELFTDDSPQPHNIANKSIESLLCDHSGNVWIATQGGGLSQCSQSTNHVSHYYKTPFAGSLPGNIVSCFLQDSYGALWIGTDGDGLCRYNKAGDVFERFAKQEGLTSNAVLGICELSNHDLAIATWNGGLNIYNRQKNRFLQYRFKSNRNDGDIQDIYGITYDKSKELLWCNTYGDGIQVFDCRTYKFLDDAQLKDLYPASKNWMYSSKIFFNDTTTWIVDGLCLSKTTPKTVTTFNAKDSIHSCIEGFFCTDILKDKQNRILITNHLGVLVYNPQCACLQQLPKTENLFPDAKAILEDRHGNLWITTSSALFRYSPKDSTYINITTLWGVPQMPYFRKSAYRSSDGHLYFGGTKGFVQLHEDSSYSKTLSPRIVITRLWINYLEQTNDSLRGDISLMHTIELDHDQSFVSIEFAALNYIDNPKSKYRYKLEGFDKDWVIAGSERKATYTNISPGRYTFLLYTTKSNGEWNNSPLRFQISVRPPWWQQWWFFVLLTVVLVSAVVAVVKNREYRIVEKNKRLKLRVNEKTQELMASNEALRQQKDTIEHNFQRLRENQVVIEMKNDQLQEALATKDRLITVIAHDFRNPLNTLLGFSRILQKKIDTMQIEVLKPTIEHVVKSSESLQDQMEIVLDWSIGNNDSIKVKPIEINPEVLIKDVLSLLNEMAVQKSISIETHCNTAASAFVDPRMISTVFRNLITNCIKFTPSEGTISVVINEYDAELEIRISDTGIGMSIEQINRIVTETAVASEDFRSGFGLQIAKAFIKRNNGRFTIDSKTDEGTVFAVYLPKGQTINKVERSVALQPEVNLDWDQKQGPRSMLVVDDNKDVTHFLREIFQDCFVVTEASNGYDACQLAKDLLPDIVLSDINMPMLDGKKLCQQLKIESVTNHIPVILISANALAQDQIDGLLHGADDYVTKPFDADMLRQKVFAILKNRELVLQHYRMQFASPDPIHLTPSHDDKIITLLTDAIMENMGNADFSVEQLTDICGLSRSQLYRKTMAILGQSPSDYIKTLRFQHAARLLKTGKYRISEVAYEVGFSDARYFSSSFSKHFGITPSGYRGIDVG